MKRIMTSPRKLAKEARKRPGYVKAPSRAITIEDPRFVWTGRKGRKRLAFSPKQAKQQGAIQ